MNIREEELYKSMDNLKGRVQKLEQNQNSFQDLFLNLLHRLNQFQDKMIVIGILNNWFLKSSEEYKLFDSEMIHHLSKKYHLNVSKEKQTLNKKVSPYLQIIKFCYEKQYEELYRNEIQSLFQVNRKTAIRIIHRVCEENKTLFECKRKANTGINSMLYIHVLSMDRLRQEYQKYF